MFTFLVLLPTTTAWSFLKKGCNVCSAAAAAVTSAIIDVAHARITLRKAEQICTILVSMPTCLKLLLSVCAGHVWVMHLCHCITSKGLCCKAHLLLSYDAHWMFLHAFDMHVQCGTMSATDVTGTEPKDGSHHACNKAVNYTTIHSGTD